MALQRPATTQEGGRKGEQKLAALIALGSSLMLFVSAIGAGQDSPSNSPLRIGLLLPPEETEAVSIRNGVELAVADANRPGTNRVTLITAGRRGQWGDDAGEAARMVLDEDVAGLISPSGGVPTHLVLQVAGRTATPVVSLSPDWSITGAGVPWAVRVVPRLLDEAQALFNGLKHPTQRTPLRWAAIVPAARAGREAAYDLNVAATNSRCELLPPRMLADTDAADVVVAEVLAKRPDAILLDLPPAQAGLLARLCRDRGYRGILAGPGRLANRAFADNAKDAAIDLVVAIPKAAPSTPERQKAFASEFRSRFGREPDQTAAMAYDATGLLIHRLTGDTAGSAPIRFPRGPGEEGVTGPLQFDDRGNRVLELELRRVRGGGLEPL